MKNNCDVSGLEPNRAVCRGGLEADGCNHWKKSPDSPNCWDRVWGHCHNLAAIRAAIEAEQISEDGRIRNVCHHPNVLTLDLCDGKGAMRKCIDCGHVAVKPEPSAAGEKGES